MIRSWGKRLGETHSRVIQSVDWLRGAAVIADWLKPDRGWAWRRGKVQGCRCTAIWPRIGYGVWTEDAPGCEDSRDPGLDWAGGSARRIRSAQWRRVWVKESDGAGT